MREEMEFYYTKTRAAVTIRHITECTRQMIPKLLQVSWQDGSDVRLMRKPGETTIIVENPKSSAIEKISKILSESFFAEGTFCPDIEFESPKQRDILADDGYEAINLFKDVTDMQSATSRLQWMAVSPDVIGNEMAYASQIAAFYDYFKQADQATKRNMIYCGRYFPAVKSILFPKIKEMNLPIGMPDLDKNSVFTVIKAMSDEDVDKLLEQIINAYSYIDRMVDNYPQ